MTKCIEQNSNAAHADCDGQPVQLFDQVFASGTFSNGFLTVLVGKDESNSAFGFGGVAGSDDLPVLQTGSSVIGIVKSSGNESVRRWGSPGGEFGFSNQNGERVLGYKIISSKPANFDGSEGVVNFNSGWSEDNFRLDDENPQQGDGSHAVDQCGGSFFDHPSQVKGHTGRTTNSNDQSKVGPVSSGAINIFVGHNCQTTTVTSKDSKDSVTKEGI